MTSNTTYTCECGPGWEGEHCDQRTNYCRNVTCENAGVCRPLFRDYHCECLSGSYSGRHCEIVSEKTRIYDTVSRSLAYIAIIAICTVVSFILIMDMLKYGFHIDPSYLELKTILDRRIQQKRAHRIRQQRHYVP